MQFVDESDAEGVVAVDLLGPQDHVERVAPSDTAREARRATPRRHRAEVQFRQADLRPLARRQAEVAGERELEPAAEAVPVERGDRRLVHRLDRSEHPQALVEHGLEAAAVLGAGHQLLEVHADREVLVAGSGEHECPHGLVRGGVAHGLLECVHVLERHPIARRVVVRQRQDAAVLLDDQCIAHCFVISPS